MLKGKNAYEFEQQLEKLDSFINKNWGFEKYQELTNRMSKHISVLRVFPGNSSGGHYNAPLLDNAINVISNDVRVSFAIMRKSVLGIGILLPNTFC